MDYDKIFENDLDRDFLFTDYPGKKLMVGYISLKNAIARLNKDEYYTFVTYHATDTLPEEYVPLSTLSSDDGTLFATMNSNAHVFYVCMNGSIQKISRLSDLSSGSPQYLLGPGPDTISLEDLVMTQYDEYIKAQLSTIKNGR